MQVIISSEAGELAKLAADRYVAVLQQKKNAVIGLATGSSPLALYQELGRRVSAGEVSFAHSTAFTLDEYVGLPPDHPEGYRNVILREFCARTDLTPAQLTTPDGQATDIAAACADYEEKIALSGGIDIQILGIGSDGHIAFNEPGGSLVSVTHREYLTLQTRRDNARFFNNKVEDVPHYAVTQGLGTIMCAKEILLIATGAQKAEAVAHLVEGSISARWPATVLQQHPQVTVLLDDAAAGKLTMIDYYKEVWEATGW